MYLFQKKSLQVFKSAGIAVNVRAWRCCDILCYISRDMLLSKDMKMKIHSKIGLYSSVGYVAQQRYEAENLFTKPPYCQTPCWLLYFHLSLVRNCLILFKMLFGFCRSSSCFFQLMSNLPLISFRNGSGGSGTRTLNGGYFTA